MSFFRKSFRVFALNPYKIKGNANNQKGDYYYEDDHAHFIVFKELRRQFNSFAFNLSRKFKGVHAPSSARVSYDPNIISRRFSNISLTISTLSQSPSSPDTSSRNHFDCQLAHFLEFNKNSRIRRPPILLTLHLPEADILVREVRELHSFLLGGSAKEFSVACPAVFYFVV